MLGAEPEYSEVEKEMFEHFGMLDVSSNVQPVLFYHMLGIKAFVDDDQSKWSEGLRRCIKALDRGTAYRMTQEWDDLILGN